MEINFTLFFYRKITKRSGVQCQPVLYVSFKDIVLCVICTLLLWSTCTIVSSVKKTAADHGS